MKKNRNEAEGAKEYRNQKMIKKAVKKAKGGWIGTQCEESEISWNKNYPRKHTRPRGYKTFSMLNSAEHEILHAHKFENIKKLSLFLGSD